MRLGAPRRRTPGDDRRAGIARRTAGGELWQWGLDQPRLRRADVDARSLAQRAWLSTRSRRAAHHPLDEAAEAVALARSLSARRLDGATGRGNRRGALDAFA